MDLITNEFCSRRNKGLIWTILQENGSFNNIENKHLQNVKNDFEIIINTSQNSFKSTVPLIERNKKVITEIVKKINIYKINDPLPTIQNQQYTQKHLQKQREEQFQENLKKQETEFTRMINKDKPKEMDFSDNIDTPIEGDMDRLLAATMAERNLQLNTVFEKQETMPNQDAIQNSNVIQNQETIHLSIGEDTNIPSIISIGDNKEEPIREKKVTFLEKLKVKPDNNTFLENRLDEILANQAKMLSNQIDILVQINTLEKKMVLLENILLGKDII